MAVFALVAAVTTLARKAAWPRSRVLALSVLVGIGLFALPALSIELAKTFIDDSTRVALFSLVPVFAIVLEPYIGSASISQQRSGLAAGLMAVAGTLMVFPLELPQTLASWVCFRRGTVRSGRFSCCSQLHRRPACHRFIRSIHIQLRSRRYWVGRIHSGRSQRFRRASLADCASFRSVVCTRYSGAGAALLADAPHDSGAYDHALPHSTARGQPHRPRIFAAWRSSPRMDRPFAHRPGSGLAAGRTRRAGANRLFAQHPTTLIRTQARASYTRLRNVLLSLSAASSAGVSGPRRPWLYRVQACRQ